MGWRGITRALVGRRRYEEGRVGIVRGCLLVVLLFVVLLPIGLCIASRVDAPTQPSTAPRATKTSQRR